MQPTGLLHAIRTSRPCVCNTSATCSRVCHNRALCRYNPHNMQCQRPTVYWCILLLGAGEACLGPSRNCQSTHNSSLIESSAFEYIWRVARTAMTSSVVRLRAGMLQRVHCRPATMQGLLPVHNHPATMQGLVPISTACCKSFVRSLATRGANASNSSEPPPAGQLEENVGDLSSSTPAMLSRIMFATEALSCKLVHLFLCQEDPTLQANTTMLQHNQEHEPRLCPT